MSGPPVLATSAQLHAQQHDSATKEMHKPAFLCLPFMRMTVRRRWCAGWSGSSSERPRTAPQLQNGLPAPPMRLTCIICCGVMPAMPPGCPAPLPPNKPICCWPCPCCPGRGPSPGWGMSNIFMMSSADLFCECLAPAIGALLDPAPDPLSPAAAEAGAADATAAAAAGAEVQAAKGSSAEGPGLDTCAPAVAAAVGAASPPWKASQPPSSSWAAGGAATAAGGGLETAGALCCVSPQAAQSPVCTTGCQRISPGSASHQSRIYVLVSELLLSSGTLEVTEVAGYGQKVADANGPHCDQGMVERLASQLTVGA